MPSKKKGLGRGAPERRNEPERPSTSLGSRDFPELPARQITVPAPAPARNPWGAAPQQPPSAQVQTISTAVPVQNPQAGRGRGRKPTSSEPPGQPGERPSTSLGTYEVPQSQKTVTVPVTTRPALSSIEEPVGESVHKPLTRPKIGNSFSFCKIGKAIKLRANHFEITIDQKKGQIFVYDIDIVPACNKLKQRYVMDAAWRDPKNLFNFPVKKIPGYGYDGNKNLFSSVKLDSAVGKEFKVSLPDDEKQRAFTVRINKLTAIRQLADIFNPNVDSDERDAIIAALDIIFLTRAKLLHGASLKRSFYYQPNPEHPFDDGTKEIWAGFYASARQGQWSMTLNADVTATVVIGSMTLTSVLDYYRGSVPDANGYLKGLKKDLKILIQFGNPQKKVNKSVRTLEKIVMLTPKSHKFEFEGKVVTLEQYYRQQYQVAVKPDLPLVEVKSSKKGVYYPLEFCWINPGQCKLGKLETMEQRELVQYVTKKPDLRYRETLANLKSKFLTPEQVEVLKDFGIAVSQDPMTIAGKVLPPVTVQGKRNQQPVDIPCNPSRADFAFSGGVNFVKLPDGGVGKWAFVSTTRRAGDPTDWIKRFVTALQQKGIACGNPTVRLEAYSPADIEKAFASMRQQQIRFALFFVEKGGPLYAPIKQFGDRQYLIATQCVDAMNRRKTDMSYLDNLILKVNVKLGGINQVLSPSTFKSQGLKPFFDEDVLVVGADVTHPGREEVSKPSIAAVVGSIDRQAAKYVAVITPQMRTADDSQVCTQEWIKDFDKTMKQLLESYYKNTGRKPRKILVYRDGVSEGQYVTVLQKELTLIQKACRDLGWDYEPLITYIVVRKRIKTKLYEVTNNGQVLNVPPGTLVEVDITQPLKYFDCFLVPHFSQLGTARPSHYVVLYDDSNFSPDELAYISFCLCHLFPRCTKAVSLPAPVYHAHLAADRANKHLEGKPLKNASRNVAEQRRVLMDHANQATTMDVENSMPNYWL